MLNIFFFKLLNLNIFGIILLKLIRVIYFSFDFLVPTYLKGNTNLLVYKTNNIMNTLENYDILFTNNINFLTLMLSISVAIAFILFLLSQANLLNLSFYPNSTFDSEKYSPYECGFAPFRTERAQFDIKFYLVALLFLVFDVELMFLLPYCLSYYYLGVLGYVIFIIFFSLLIIGFLVEWAVGMLTWKGEEKTPISLQKNTIFQNKNNIKATNYIKYNNQYLNYIDKYYFGLKFFKYLNNSAFLFL